LDTEQPHNAKKLTAWELVLWPRKSPIELTAATALMLRLAM
jgi:hypothetical protein